MTAQQEEMVLADERTIEALDFQAIRERLARETHSSLATARVLALQPGPVDATAQRLVTQTSEMRALVAATGFSLERVEHVSDWVAAAALGSTLAPGDLRAIGIMLAASGSAVRRAREFEAPTLHALCAPFVALPHIAARIENAIGERGEVLDRASPALARLRRQITSAQEEARERTAAVLRAGRFARILQDAIVTVREGRYVVPIKAEFSGEFPGIVHDSSASGQTLFVEPLAALDANNRLRSLRMQEEHEVTRILTELSQLVGSQAPTIERDAQIYAELDEVAAKARVADAMRAVPPAFTEAADVDIIQGRHPLLGDRAIPQSVHLDDRERIMVISGPNMGGKTVTLKMVGLFVLMAACGMHLPALEGTKIGRFRRVFTDIGDEQSIAQNASTFSAHLRRLSEIVRAADNRTLILIDEIGSGTEPSAGAALAVAILEHFLATGARVIATTHATELKLFAHQTEGVQNASVRFNPQTYAPTFELDVGSPGQSLAFALARSMGLDQDVVVRGEHLLSTAERDYDRAVAELAEIRTKAAAERTELARELERVRSAQADARREATALESQRKTFAREADERLARTLREFTAELARRAGDRAGGRARVTPGQSVLLTRTLDEIHRELGLEETRQEGEAPAHLEPGDRVHVISLDQDATIVEDLGRDALVAIGAMRSTVPKSDLRKGSRADRGPRQAARVPAGAPSRVESVASARTELDVRGKRFVEAEPLVERWIDDALLAGYSPLRLIHGKGTGLLGRGLQQYLRGHEHVTGVRYGNENEGGSGVTIFELR